MKVNFNSELGRESSALKKSLTADHLLSFKQRKVPFSEIEKSYHDAEADMKLLLTRESQPNTERPPGAGKGLSSYNEVDTM